MPTITSSATNFVSGATAIAGTGQETTFTFGGTFVTGDNYTIILTDTATGLQTQIGAGNVTGIIPNYCFVFQNKVYVLAGSSVYFTALGQPTVFNDPNGTGNGFVTMSDYFSTPENLTAIASYQGRLAFFARGAIQIWSVTANPATWQQQQVMENIGTFAGRSVQTVGDFDVFFLSDTGVRSLRTLNITLNAYVDDLGSPIDSLVLAQLATLSETQKASACAVVEPTYHRYLLFVPSSNPGVLPGTIYVYSGFRSSKVSAWSTYIPSYYDGVGQAIFIPQNFETFQNKVYTRDATALYGLGITGNIYDNCVATVISPWMDMKKPVEPKQAEGVDMVAFGDYTTNPSDPCNWALFGSVDPISAVFQQIVQVTNPNTAAGSPNPSNPAIQATANSGSFEYRDRGTHFAFKATTSGTGSAVFSEIIYRYMLQGEKR